MLTERLILSNAPPDEPEDIFCSALTLLFPNDVGNQHGSPGSSVTYRSARFGEVELHLADPEGEEDRLLFSHYVWNAGLQLTELIEHGDDSTERGCDVRDKGVLELGAGSGLCGIVSGLAGAKRVVLSDFPAAPILKNLLQNMRDNQVTRDSKPVVAVEGHVWGEVTSPWASTNQYGFDRVLAADCLWMPAQHENLVKSMLHFLALKPDARVWVVAGFHTGRGKVAAFFNVAEQEGLVVDRRWEQDISGLERPWQSYREGEGRQGSKRWSVIATMKRGKREEA